MIIQSIPPKAHDLGGFEVFRALPSAQRRMVGPFIFWDQMGPGEFLTGQGLDVRPHPHVGLATLTYLFQGELLHRDSLGHVQPIYPGDVNLMVAGKGIVHSERTPEALRQHPHELFGIQSWLALPIAHEETAASFSHISRDHLPTIEEKGLNVRIIAGSYQGLASPVAFPHDLIYLDVHIKNGEKFFIPSETEERAVYPLKGQLLIQGNVFEPRQLLILPYRKPIVVEARGDCHFMVFGGAAMGSPRHIWWNFVSSSKERIEEAKYQWQQGLFPMITGETEFIPLPNA